MILAILEPWVTRSVQLNLDILIDPEAIHPAYSPSTQTNDLIQRLCLERRPQDTMQKRFPGFACTMDSDFMKLHRIMADVVDLYTGEGQFN